MRELTFITEVSATPAEVYRFHAQVANLRELTPSRTTVVSIQGDPEAAVGASFQLRFREFGFIPLSWEGQWEEVVPEKLLVDIATRSPFPTWRHEHHFLPSPQGEETGCIIEDRVTYSTPLGLRIGDSIAATQLRGMFAFRKKRCQELFGKPR